MPSDLGLEVSEADRERILSCKDEGLLGVWLKRAFIATLVGELWGAGEVPAQAVAARSGSAGSVGGEGG